MSRQGRRLKTYLVIVKYYFVIFDIFLVVVYHILRSVYFQVKNYYATVLLLPIFFSYLVPFCFAGTNPILITLITVYVSMAADVEFMHAFNNYESYF